MHYVGLFVSGKEIHRVKSSNKANLAELFNKIGRGKLTYHWQIFNNLGQVVKERHTYGTRSGVQNGFTTTYS